MIFTRAESTFLAQQPIGRLATIGPVGEPQIRPVGVHLGPGHCGIDIVGHVLSRTQKWRNVLRDNRAAFIVDEVIAVQPPQARGIEIRGTAIALPGAGSTDGGLSGDVIRISPRRIIAWGLDSPGTTARDVQDDERDEQ
ncbi:PPOX class F420-dependent oxidoreductase [Mycolicibacter algericus]|uniref:PPOX class F420-dependent oxidoreductase n=2 Tax=Mycolicibacter algericus TaxID=1288388 RepID=A0A7I9YC30_MYCAL|nr:PPOX class F420-dependent oxidoreductase [Mycolicibacter algericus]OQZ96456.1 pyridoxamine 5'-phosphate oxidase [Mycolicibacter algericus DSM 45454]GFG86255.1 PPOX class F420-dependent oxidoreductase [Mycolicibacter algericus]